MTRLAVLADDPDGPVVRHRFRALLPWLRDAGLDDVRFLAVTKGHRARRATFAAAAECGNVLVVRRLFQRFDFAALRGAARRLAFDFDDAVQFRDPFQGRTRSYVRERRFLRAVRGADLVTAGNDYLAALAGAAKGEAPIVVAPTPIDADRYRPRTSTFVGSPHTDDRRGFRVGWIGSRSTRPYLAVVAAALRDVARRRPDLVVAVMADAAPRDLTGLPVEFKPWSETAEVPFLQSLHAGIMPLTDDPWSRGKCGFKLLQTMACGVPSVASPVGVNSVIARDGAALLAGTDAEWAAALLGIADDPAAAAALGARGRAAVEAHWSAAVLGPRFAQALATWANSAGAA